MMFLSPTALWAWLVIPLLFALAVPLVRVILARIGADDIRDSLEKTALAVMLLPFAAGLVMVPFALSLPDVVPTLAPDAPQEIYQPTSDWAASAEARAWPGMRHLGFIPWVILAVTGWKLARVLRGLLSLYALARRAEPSPMGNDVAYSGTAPMPMVLPHGVVLFPSQLVDTLADDDIAMILAHERAHVRRGDPLYFIGLAIIDALFWFHPGFRWQTKRCRLAAELACDQAACADDPAARKAYAGLVVKVLQHAAGAGAAHAPAVFSPQNKGEYDMRLTRIMRPVAAKGRRGLFAAIAAGLALPFGIGQWAIAQEGASANFTVMPIEEGRITSGFGVRTDPFLKDKRSVHWGTDVGAPLGTPLKAPAAGVVTFAGPRGSYGNLVDIAHEGGVITRYSQLDKVKVAFGEQVAAGQSFATVGNSGRSTAPHLHMEVFMGGKRVDPETVIRFPTER